VADDDGMMSLIEAILVDKPEWGEFPLLLLERGVDPFMWDDAGVLFMEAMAFCQGTRTIRAMAELVPRVEDRHFIAALKWANPGAIRVLLQMGFDANTPLLIDDKVSIPPIMVVTRNLYELEVLLEWPQAREALRELLSGGANLKASVPATGFAVLHDFFLEIFKPLESRHFDYDIVCQHLVSLIDNGADPRAVDRRGRTPSVAAWSSQCQQASVLVWYRVLRMCNLDPVLLDANYDPRFDTNDKCYFCLLDAGSKTGDFMFCPWCCNGAYTRDRDWNNPLPYDGSKNNPMLGIMPCCPTAVCRFHRHPLEARKGGFLLPKKSGGMLQRVKKCAELGCEICAAGNGKWDKRRHYTLSLDSNEDENEDGEDDEDENYEDAEDVQEFHDTVEVL